MVDAVDEELAADPNEVEVTSLGLGSVVIPPLDETQTELLDMPVDSIPE